MALKGFELSVIKVLKYDDPHEDHTAKLESLREQCLAADPNAREDMAMNEKVVMVSNDYDRIDGRNAYQSDIKCLTLGAPMREENNKMQIAAQIWKNDKDG